MNYLVLFSGNDERFTEAGYLYPKNLIEINERPLIQHVLESLALDEHHITNLILAIRKNESERFHTATSMHLLYPNAKIINVPSNTSGASCTALLAVKYIDNEEPLTIINGDIILEDDINLILHYFEDKDVDGGAVTFESVHPRWSYVKCNDEGIMIEAAEKRPISKEATAGIYYYKHGCDFVEAAKDAIRKDAQTDGIYYICPVFNEMILKQKKLITYSVDARKYFSLSTPKGVEKYQKHLEDIQHETR